MQRTKRDCITSAMSVNLLDQLQLVPSGGDGSPRGTSTEQTFFCHDIRVQLRVVTIRVADCRTLCDGSYPTALIRQDLYATAHTSDTRTVYRHRASYIYAFCSLRINPQENRYVACLKNKI
jgi:hypothetical protein